MISRPIETHSCESPDDKDTEEMEEDIIKHKCLVCRLPSNSIWNEGQPGTCTPPASRSHVLGIEVCTTTQSIHTRLEPALCEHYSTNRLPPSWPISTMLTKGGFGLFVLETESHTVTKAGLRLTSVA